MIYKLILFAVLTNLSISTEMNAQIAQRIYQKASPSVVTIVIFNTKEEPVSLGSGFLVDKDIVVTNKHVIDVKGAKNGFVKICDKDEEYKIIGCVGVDSDHDLAVLKIDGRLTSLLSIGDSRQLKTGEEIYVLGSPMGLEGTISEGIVSNLRTDSTNSIIIQITAPISPGSSGGPVLNSQGEVIGVAFASRRVGQNLNFAVPSEYVSNLLSKLNVDLQSEITPPAAGTDGESLHGSTMTEGNEYSNNSFGGGYYKESSSSDSLFIILLLLSGSVFVIIVISIFKLSSRKLLIAVGNKNKTSIVLLTLNFRKYLKEIFVIGRDKNCDIWLNSKFVSKTHARIRRIGEEYIIEDLNSKNGIYVSGKRIKSDRLQQGKTYSMGDYILWVKE